MSSHKQTAGDDREPNDVEDLETARMLEDKEPPSDAVLFDNTTPFQRGLKILAAVSFYWVTSLSLVFINKYVFSAHAAPLFLTWTQLVVAVLLCWVLSELSARIKFFNFFPPFEYRTDVALKVLPLAFIFIAMIVFNNLCLKFVDVSFYQVARSLTILFNIMFTFLILGKTTSKMCLLWVGVIVMGYLIGCKTFEHVPFLGVVFGVCASCFVSLYSIFTKKAFEHVDNNSWKLMMYNNINSTFLMLPVIYFLEYDELRNATDMNTSEYWAMIMLAGVFGFLINFATFTQIGATSPLTHNVSGTAKACAQTLLAIIFLGDMVTGRGWIGILAILGGSFAYSRQRWYEMESNRRG